MKGWTKAGVTATAVYMAGFLFFCIYALLQDSKLSFVSEPLHRLEAAGSWRLDHGPMLDGPALVASLASRPFTPANGVRANFQMLFFEGAYLWQQVQVPPLDPSVDGWTVWLDDARARDARLVVSRSGAVTTRAWTYGDPANVGLGARAKPVFHLSRDELEGATVYTAHNSYSALRGRLALGSRAAFEDAEFRENMWLTLMHGALLAIAVYLAVIGFRLAAPAMMHAAAMSFFLMLRSFGDTGLQVNWLLPKLPMTADVVIYASQAVATAFWLLFLIRFVELDALRPRIAALLRIIALLIPLQAGLILARGGFFPWLPIYSSAALPTLVGMIAGLSMLFVLTFLGNRRARAFLICWLPIGIGSGTRIYAYLVPSSNLQLGVFTKIGFDVAISMVALGILLTLDIQHRERKLRQAAALSEQRYRDYAEIGADGVFEVGPGGVLRSAAGPLARDFGLEAGVDFAARLPGLSPETSLHALARPVRAAEFLLEGHATPRWISFSSLPLESGDGFRAVISDVSATVSAREDESRRNTLAALGQLAGGIAHEVNNLLHPIINLSRRVSDRHVGDADGKRLMDLVVKSGVRAGEIVRQVLHAYAPSSFAGYPVPISQAVNDALDTVRVTLPSACRLTCDIASVGRPEIRVGEAIQVLSNLVSNAVRAMEGSGDIAVRLRGFPHHVELSVSDKGPGMEEALRQKAMEAFVTESRGGTGLGLSIVRQIAEGWGGSVHIDSTPGQGAVFTLRIPA